VIENLIRVPRHCSKRVVFVNALSSLERVHPYDTGTGGVGISVGCVPFIDHPEELRFRRVTRGRESFYSITPRSVLERRASEALMRLDQSRCVLGIVPELALSAELLEAWRKAVVRAKPKRSRLKWILIGTGAVRQHRKSAAAANTAVLLDRQSGLEVAHQNKRSPFNLQDDDIDRYGLRPYLGPGPLREFMSEGTELTVIEAEFGRLALYVCEDLERIDTNMAQAGDLGITHLLVPVFSKALVDQVTGRWSWEVVDASKYSDGLGMSVAVGTSLVLHRAMIRSTPGSPINPPAVTSASFSPTRPRDLEPIFGRNPGDPVAVAVHPLAFRRAIS
jgi:hypothetical protein